VSAYGAFAGIYDMLMDDFDYPAWAEYYMELIGHMGVTPKTMCDCACGTGSLTIPFAARGIRVTGVDLSGEMLEYAAVKARRNGQKIMFVCQDMSHLELPRAVDAIVCGCDGVNYLIGESKLRAFFESAHKWIKPGGVLAFDISSPYKLEHVLGNGFFGEERDEVAYLWSNRFDEEKRTVQMDLTFFRREQSGLYRRFTENHTQCAHEPTVLKAIMEDCGFTDVRIYGDRTFEAPKADELRIHIAAVRA